jgi:hypothetical protein
MLICKFASPRSDLDRIDTWISYLEEKKRRHGGDPDAAHLLDRLLRQAHGWRSRRGTSRPGNPIPMS